MNLDGQLVGVLTTGRGRVFRWCGPNTLPGIDVQSRITLVPVEVKPGRRSLFAAGTLGVVSAVGANA